MPDSPYDLIVIGAGPGGYVAALRASQLGMKVAVVEKRTCLGGVCLNEGCIPSKALLDSSELFVQARDNLAGHGIGISSPKLDLGAMMLRKKNVVKKLADGVESLFKKRKIDLFQGVALLKGCDALGKHLVEVKEDTLHSPATERQQAFQDLSSVIHVLKAPKVILATGSEAAALPGIPFDGQVVVSAREALSFDKPPEHLVVAGGSYIGLEMGSIWNRLGTRVTVIEMLPRILASMDKQIADTLYRSLRKQGIQFRLGTRITGVRRLGTKAIVQFNAGAGSEEIDCDKLLVAVGRHPLIEGLGLVEIGVRLDDKGKIVIDENFQTSVAGIHAIGDLVHGPMLAHKASTEGVVCVEQMNGQPSVVEYEYIPGIVYTRPEGASVGVTEEQLKECGIPYRSGSFNFSASGRARCLGETEGFVKILAHHETDRILGVHMCGTRVSDLIAEAVSVMSFGGTARDIALTCHAHPTLSEAIREAALDVHGEALHT